MPISGSVSVSDSLLSRASKLRSSRSFASLRSACRPSQNKLSATRLGSSLPLRRSANACPAGCSRLTGATGPSDSTQTSLLPSPEAIESPSQSPPGETRHKPPGMAV
jgi:hypothetical protein